jgi:SSS family solute:Na+ symporter
MITWAAVIYNDILGPFRRKDTSEATGLLINRMIVAMIGVFLLFYGLFYELEGALWDYLTTTGTVYLSSMSVLLIACCYWKGANNWGATASIVVGAAFPIGYLILEKMIPGGADELHKVYGFNQDRAKIAAFALSGISMVVFSKLKPKPNLEA